MARSNKAQLQLSPLEEIVLIALMSRELYGLEIIKTIEKASNGKRRIGFGSLYPTLHRLEKRGLVQARWGEDATEREGARRRYYKITGIGEKALKDVERIRTNLFALRPALGRV